jgi:hypothetical protein
VEAVGASLPDLLLRLELVPLEDHLAEQVLAAGGGDRVRLAAAAFAEDELGNDSFSTSPAVRENLFARADARRLTTSAIVPRMTRINV